ncbi:hypothetical protein AAFF_G00415990 [Aldrovandia affinis]|uniref:Ig-like domain-containing protein n=1 Tax=Aldrovandia affinis TaxID=143900 RepID=A0AAD7R5J4_9TELE|nr:hypothetical protein AAFF_G00415990 [Aldrovandia affinis]
MKRKHAGALICMLTALAVPLSAASAGDFSVSVPSAPVSVWLGDSVTLPCSVTPPMDVSPLEVRWYRPPHHNAPFLLYKDRRIEPSSQDNKYQGRVFLVGLGSGVGGLEGGNVSLSLRNVTMADSGAYECYVGSLQWYDVGRISLQVNKLGSIPVLSVHPGVGGQQVNVSCVSDGWSPKPSLIWRNREGRELKDQQGLFYSTDPQGLVTVSGWLLFSPSDSGWLSCTVSLSGGDSREGRVAPHTPGTDESVGWIARFITLLVLSVSAITVTVLFIRSRKTKLGSIPVLSVHPGVGGQQVNVSCVSDGWSPNPASSGGTEREELKDQQGLFYSTDPQGLVTVSGWLLFSPSDSGWLSCTVSLSGGDSREGRVAPHTPGTGKSEQSGPPSHPGQAVSLWPSCAPLCWVSLPVPRPSSTESSSIKHSAEEDAVWSI